MVTRIQLVVLTRPLSAVIVCLVLMGSPQAMATSIEAADQLYAQGKQMADAGNCRDAINLYVKAYSTYPQARYVFGMAACYETLGDLPAALDAYEQFNQYEPSQEVLTRVQAEIDRIKQELSRAYGSVYVFSSPRDSQVFVGQLSRHSLYRTPIRRWLKPGEHSIFFKKDGFQPRELKVTVKEGEHVWVYVGLKADR